MASKKKTRSLILRKEIHLLVEELPDEELYGAKRFLGYLRNSGDPIIQALLEARLDNEKLNKEEEGAVNQAWKAVADGNVVTDEELARRLGL